MTSLDPSTDQLATDTSPSADSPFPKRPGLWRLISMFAVATAIALTAMSVLQARAASDVPVADRAPVVLETTMVTVTDLPLLGVTEVATLGLPSSESRRIYDPAGTELEIPRDRVAVIALTSEDSSLIGLRLISATEDRSEVEISARSTARALVALSPGVLGTDLDATLREVDGYTNVDAFDVLVDAVRLNPNISTDNEGLEAAYAAIADRIALQDPAADQGCDSVSASNAYASAGACVQPNDAGGVLVTNEQDRWALVFAEAGQFGQLCTALSPTNTAHAEVLIESQDCPGDALIVAPGPASDQGSNQSLIDNRVRTAAAFNVLYNYAGPFTELAASGAGFTDQPVDDLFDDAEEITAALADLVDRSEEFSAAADVWRIAATPLDRELSTATATRLIIDIADSTAILPQRTAGDIGHLPILDFYARSAERMLSERIDWRWEAAAVGRISLGDTE